jgi:branched-subunit amino acid transport protein AzlD
MKLTSTEALIATLAIGLMMLLLRFLPFVIFSNRKSPAFFSFIEKFIPALSIAVLFLVCFKERTTDLIFKSSNFTLSSLAIVAFLIASTVASTFKLP